MNLTYLHIQQKEAKAFEEAIRVVNSYTPTPITIENVEEIVGASTPTLKYSLSIQPCEAFYLGIEFEEAKRKSL